MRSWTALNVLICSTKEADHLQSGESATVSSHEIHHHAFNQYYSWLEVLMTYVYNGKLIEQPQSTVQ